jgi:FKBP-type peptidyl-prolyl cis-trans isomerase
MHKGRIRLLGDLFLVCLALSTFGAACQKKTDDGDRATADIPSASASAAPPVAARPPPPGPPPIPPPPDVAAPPDDAEKTASGLASKVLTPGTGKDHPATTDKVRVHYTGWTKSGDMFDSSIQRGKPATFGLGAVIKGWTEGLQLMVVGEKRRLWIPSKMAYGDNPHMGRPAGDLVFDVELLEILPTPKTPEDVAAAPPTAKKTASGLAYRVLTPGSGPHPTASNTVTVNYSGWTPDGKMFDSSVTRGTPAHFGLGSVIKGWTEGVQLMNKGEKARFWIPGNLAYGDTPGRPGTPTGPLVFDIELIDFN